MEKDNCNDCGKSLEPDKALRFFENDQASGRLEGYLCEACACRSFRSVLLGNGMMWNGQNSKVKIIAARCDHSPNAPAFMHARPVKNRVSPR